MTLSLRILAVLVALGAPALAQSAAPAQAQPSAPTGATPPEVNYDERSGKLEARQGLKVLWADQLPVGTPVQFANDRLYHASGTTVVERDLPTGRPTARAYLSGPVVALEAQGAGSTSGDLRAVVRHDAGGAKVEESFSLRGGKPLATAATR